MQDDEGRRPSFRRNSASSRRNSLKKERSLEETDKEKPQEKKRASSATSTPKRVVRGSSVVDFVVTGKQIGTRSERALSLPGGRRPAAESFSLDLSQVSDFEDTSLKYSIRKMTPLATSTPKPRPGPKPRSASLQSHISHISSIRETRRSQKSLDEAKSKDCLFSCSRDSYKSTASTYRAGAGESSAECSQSSLGSPPSDLALSPRSQLSSGCVSWCGCGGSEWERFWKHYSDKMPTKSYYDHCPTPYRTETIDFNDFDFASETPARRSPDNIQNINTIIRNEGLQLTPRETQNIIKCAHILGSVLSKAIDRRSKTLTEDVKDDVKQMKKNLTLDLKETAVPLQVKELKQSESATQTDISLPNTKSAPRIFESILRQLSKSSIDEGDETLAEKDADTDKDTL